MCGIENEKDESRGKRKVMRLTEILSYSLKSWGLRGSLGWEREII